MLSIPHLLIIFLVALIVLGPDKLPQVARVLGKTMAEFRRITSDFRMTIEGEVREMERQAELKQAAAAAQAEVDSALEAVDSVARDVSHTGVENEPHPVPDPVLPPIDAAAHEQHLPPPETQEHVEAQEPVAASTPSSPEKLTNG
jgi:sec-independent protein translocase protein TatA